MVHCCVRILSLCFFLQMKLKGSSIRLSDKKLCQVCQNPFCEPVFVRYPNGGLVHTHCATSRHTNPSSPSPGARTWRDHPRAPGGPRVLYQACWKQRAESHCTVSQDEGVTSGCWGDFSHCEMGTLPCWPPCIECKWKIWKWSHWQFARPGTQSSKTDNRFERKMSLPCALQTNRTPLPTPMLDLQIPIRTGNVCFRVAERRHPLLARWVARV